MYLEVTSSFSFDFESRKERKNKSKSFIRQGRICSNFVEKSNFTLSNVSGKYLKISAKTKCASFII